MLSGVVFTQPWSTTLNDTYFDILFLVHVPRKLKEQFSNHHYGLKFLSYCEKKPIIPTLKNNYGITHSRNRKQKASIKYCHHDFIMLMIH